MKSVFLIMVNNRRFGTGPRKALSIDRDFDPAANVNVLSSTLVWLYRARFRLLMVELRANNMAGFGLTCQISN